jgi:hypothetical protein
VIFWPVNFIVGSISPALISSKAYSGIFAVLTFVVSVVLGIAILRMRSWARAALMTILRRPRKSRDPISPSLASSIPAMSA